MNIVGEFERFELNPDHIRQELSIIEQKGIQAYVEEVFDDKFGWTPLQDCFWTTNFSVPVEHVGLGYSGELELDDDIYLHHFLFTVNGLVIAVCQDEKENEYYYLIVED